MNRLYPLLAALLLTVIALAQAPQKMSYQAVVRDAGGHLIINKQIAIQIGLKVYSSEGIFLRYDYNERHVTTTNTNGLVTLEIGNGEPSFGTFSKIDWTYGEHYIVVGIDLDGGGTYSISGESKLLSVPYALYAATAEKLTGAITETDPLFSSSVASKITATDTAKWNQSNTAAGVQLDSAGIATMGYVAGPKTIDTKLDETAVDAFVANNGYLTQEKDSSVTNEIELPTGGNSGQILSTDGSGTYSWIDAGAGGLVADTINDGTTTVAPSQNAVFDGLALKAPIASPTFTGTVAGIDKTMVGLTNVDNTSDANKPVSTATQTVLDLKESANNKSTDGTLATNSDNLFPTEKAVKTYVDAIAASAGVADASTTAAGKIQLAGDLSGTATAPTVPSLALKAPLASPTFTGEPVAPTATSGTNTTQVATTAFVTAAVLQPGTATGQMNYWNGTAWVVVAPGASLPGNQAQTLVFCNGVPTWGTCPAVVPTLTSTTAASSIGGSTASSGGVISDDGGGSITARGVAWGTNTSPTISGSYTADGTGTGSFTSSLSGLTGNTTYYVRAYATNSAGTAYGAEVSFITDIVIPFSGDIGDAYQGGKVAYILQSGDPGYVAGEVHGLIAATSDQSTGIIWNNDGTKATRGATGEVIGTGLANTNAIINKQGEPATSYAAGLARAYTGGGYTDWYLPSKEELNKLYINRVAIGGFALVSESWYWNSTEYNLSVFTFAWCQNFYNGRQDAMNDVTWAVYVRAVRSF
jgi:hypothetical protein